VFIEVAKQVEMRGPKRPAVCFAVLAVSVAILLIPISVFAFYRTGWLGVAAAMVAALVCWLAATIALAIVVLFRGPKHGVSGILGSMLIRMALPLVAGTVLSRQGGPLAEAGVFGMIVVFYLFTLAIETLLSVSLVGQASSAKQSAAI
jgi:hypothetical protein